MWLHINDLAKARLAQMQVNTDAPLARTHTAEDVRNLLRKRWEYTGIVRGFITPLNWGHAESCCTGWGEDWWGKTVAASGEMLDKCKRWLRTSGCMMHSNLLDAKKSFRPQNPVRQSGHFRVHTQFPED